MITYVSQTRTGSITQVTVSSSLSDPVYYFWYLDGAFVGMTTDPTNTFALSPGDQASVDVLDSNDPAFDPIANAPTQYSARRTVSFIRSLDADVDKYQVDQQANGGSFTTIATVQDDPGRWFYEVLSPRLTDLTTYVWRVTPIDRVGNLGTAVTMPAEYIVRTPDAPDFTVSFNPANQKVTFAAA